MMKKEVIELFINNKKIEMNPYVKRVFLNIINALVKSLDKLPNDKSKIEIFINKSSPKNINKE